MKQRIQIPVLTMIWMRTHCFNRDQAAGRAHSTGPKGRTHDKDTLLIEDRPRAGHMIKTLFSRRLAAGRAHSTGPKGQASHTYMIHAQEV